MKKLAFATLTAATLFSGSAAMAERVCVDWIFVVCGEIVSR